MQLRAEKINFKYKEDKYILKDIDFTIKSGEVVGLVAPSGFGKTTLAKILAGYENPERGTVTIDGEKITNKGYNKVQLIFQHPEKSVNPRWKMDKILKLLQHLELNKIRHLSALRRRRQLVEDGQDGIPSLERPVELEQELRRELEPDLPVYDLLETPGVVRKMPYARLLQGVVAEHRDVHRGVPEVLPAPHARDGEKPRGDRVALHHREHRLRDHALQKRVHSF